MLYIFHQENKLQGLSGHDNLLDMQEKMISLDTSSCLYGL